MRTADISKAVFKTVGKYGLQKTTMSDIANAAGISRQTLYNTYSNKEEILRAAVKFFMDQDLQAVKDAWADMATLPDKLDVYFEKGPINWYDQIQEMPDAADLMEGISEVVEPALKEADTDWIHTLALLFSEYMESAKANEVADFVFVSSKNAKYSAKTRDQLINRLALLKEMVVSTFLNEE